MESDVFMQIKLNYNTFTKSHKKLADFVLKDPEFFLKNSISEVAAACSVAEATITRFCRSLEFNGYHDFKMALVKSLTLGEELITSAAPDMPEDGSMIRLSREIYARDIEALQNTLALLNEDDLQKAIDLLTGARHILFFGVGSSTTAALEGANKFMRISSNVIINIETHMQYISAATITADDVAVIISYSGSTTAIVEMARKIKEKGAKIICITRYQKSPLTSYSDVVLLCCSNEHLVYGHSISMEVTQIFILDILYTEYFNRTEKLSNQNYEDVSSILTGRLY